MPQERTGDHDLNRCGSKSSTGVRRVELQTRKRRRFRRERNSGDGKLYRINRRQGMQFEAEPGLEQPNAEEGKVACAHTTLPIQQRLPF